MGITDSGCSVGVPQSRMGQMGGMGKGYSAGRQDCCGGGSDSAGKQGRNNNLELALRIYVLKGCDHISYTWSIVYF